MVDRTDKTPILFGTFTATFTFALVVLSQVRENAVPDVSVLVSLLLLLISVGLLLRLLATFRTTLTTGGLARAVGNELREVIDVMYPVRFDPAASAAAAAQPTGKPQAAPSWLIRHVGVPGVFQAFDEPAVVRLAAGTGTEIRFIPAVGDFLRQRGQARGRHRARPRRGQAPPPGPDRPAPHAGAGPGLRNPAAGRHRAPRAVARDQRSHQRGAGTRPARRCPAAAGQAVAWRWPPARREPDGSWSASRRRGGTRSWRWRSTRSSSTAPAASRSPGGCARSSTTCWPARRRARRPPVSARIATLAARGPQRAAGRDDRRPRRWSPTIRASAHREPGTRRGGTRVGNHPPCAMFRECCDGYFHSTESYK